MCVYRLLGRFALLPRERSLLFRDVTREFLGTRLVELLEDVCKFTSL